ncbi:UNVERIFIED_CONTAM: hypothetical protein HDU68_004564, partial [Siphonaria sp. JEL0065]
DPFDEVSSSSFSRTLLEAGPETCKTTVIFGLMMSNDTTSTPVQSFMSKQRIIDLNDWYEKLKTALINRVDPLSASTAEEFFESFDSRTEMFSKYKTKLDAFLENNKTKGSDGTSVSDSVGKFVTAIEGVADTNPVLKIAWLAVTAGCKMIKKSAEDEVKWNELIDCFTDASKQFERLKTFKTKVPDDTRTLLVVGLDIFLDCLIEFVETCTDHLNKPSMSSLFGSSDTKSLDDVTVRLINAQAKLGSVRTDGVLEIVVSTAGNLVDVKEIAAENLETSKNAIPQIDEDNAETAALRSHCQFTEIHGIAEFSFLASKRNPKTSGWIIDQMVGSIVNQKNPKNIVWLRGEAGTGKSVIAGCVAFELEKEGVLGASFFCQHDNKLRDNISALIQTLCFELALKEPSYRKALITSLENSKFKDKTNHSVRNLVALFIATPFQDWPNETPCAIVIDALDELVDHADVSLVLDAFQSLKQGQKPVKVFVTSRPDVVVGAKRNKLFEIEVLDVEAKENKDDVRIFTQDRLLEMRDSLVDPKAMDTVFDKLVETLVEGASGLFVWITLVLGNVRSSDKFVVTEENGFDVIGEALEEVTSPSGESKETGKQLVERLQQSVKLDLQSLYCRVLFKAYTNKDDIVRFKTCVGVVLLAQVPLSADAIHQILLSMVGLDTKLTKIEVNRAFRLLQSLLKTDKDEKLSFIHKTIADYLHSIGCHTSCPGKD